MDIKVPSTALWMIKNKQERVKLSISPSPRPKSLFSALKIDVEIYKTSQQGRLHNFDFEIRNVKMNVRGR